MRLVIAGLILFILSSCASIFQAGPDNITITSNPSGAAVTLDGADIGVTPVATTVRRNADGVFTLDLPGYTSRSIRLPTEVNGTVGLNFFLGWLFPVGLAVDLLSGNGSRWMSPAQVQMRTITQPTVEAGGSK